MAESDELPHALETTSRWIARPTVSPSTVTRLSRPTQHGRDGWSHLPRHMGVNDRLPVDVETYERPTWSPSSQFGEQSLPADKVGLVEIDEAPHPKLEW